jgi:hypothetical protein
VRCGTTTAMRLLLMPSIPKRWPTPIPTTRCTLTCWRPLRERVYVMQVYHSRIVSLRPYHPSMIVVSASVCRSDSSDRCASAPSLNGG